MEVLLEDCGAEVGKLWKICITHRLYPSNIPL